MRASYCFCSRQKDNFHIGNRAGLMLCLMQKNTSFTGMYELLRSNLSLMWL